jgi:ABC-type nitrate/sulfonate/bicarbonate transport system substrate-binding protein
MERENEIWRINMKKQFIWFILLFFTIVLSACSEEERATQKTSTEKAEEQKSLKIRYAPLGGSSGIAVKFGEEKGFFKEAGLDIEFIEIQDPVAGLISGDVDVADGPTTNAILAAGKGAPIKIVSSMFRSKGAFYLLGNESIQSVEDLKGKTIGVAKFGTGLDVYTRIILQEHGIDPDKDVTLIANGTHQEAYASLTNKQVDATIIHEPWVSLAESEGKGKLLARGWDYLPNFHTGVLMASDQAIKENGEAIKRLLSAYFKSQEYAKEHLDEFKAFYLANIKVNEDVLEATLNRENEIWENNPDVSKDALIETQEIQKELVFQDQIYDIEKLLDLRFITKK